MSQTKVCSKCNEEKDISEFIPCARGLYGVRGECRQCKRSYDMEFNRTHYASKFARERRYRETHKLQIANKKREWQKNNPEKVSTTNSRFIRTDKGRASLSRRNSNRRLKNKSVKNTLTAKQFSEIIALQDGRCADCGNEFTDARKPTRDHIIPVYFGGSLSKGNVQALCKYCNSSKRNRMPFLRAIDTLLVDPC